MSSESYNDMTRKEIMEDLICYEERNRKLEEKLEAIKKYCEKHKWPHFWVREIMKIIDNVQDSGAKSP